MGKLFVALKKKSTELEVVTGDGRLDLMDILLEFTKVLREMKNASEDNENHSDTLIAAAYSPRICSGDGNFRTKTRRFLSEKGNLARSSLFSKNSTPQPFSSLASYSQPGPRLQSCDLNLRRMSYNDYRELLDKYANDRRWCSGIFKT